MITYLISGASRGLGLGLVERVLELQDARVTAAARNPGKSDELQKLAKDSLDRLTLLTIDTSSECSIKVCGMRQVLLGSNCSDTCKPCKYTGSPKIVCCSFAAQEAASHLEQTCPEGIDYLINVAGACPCFPSNLF